MFYHPRSIVQINDYELNSTLMPFEQWENGEELFIGMDRDADLLDRDIRPWAEECDQMQGIQVFFGGDDAWGGFASRYVEKLRDEYGRLPIWTWGIEEEQGRGQRAKQVSRTINAARTISEMATQASMYVPLAIPAMPLPWYVEIDCNSQWHASALLSMALESMTLPSRLGPDTQRRGLFSDIEAGLNVNGNQRIAQLQCTILDPKSELPVSVNGHGSHDDRAHTTAAHAMVEEDDVEAAISGFDMNLSAGSSGSQSDPSQHRTSYHTFGAVESIRGQAEESKNQELDEDEMSYARKRRRFAGFGVVERFDHAVSEKFNLIVGIDAKTFGRYHSSLEYSLLDSFPRILALRPDLTKVAVRTSLSTTSGIAKRVEALQKIVGRMIKLDERESLTNGLCEISEAYEEGWNSGSDRDSDD